MNSIHGKFKADINFDDKHLIINKNKITFSQEIGKNMMLIMFLNVLENLILKEKLKPHINNGAKKGDRFCSM